MIPETKLKVSDKVKALIQNMIFKEMKPGDKLPSEAMLSELFSASRSSIREALQALESARIVEKRNNGTFVTSQLEECFVNPLSIMIQLSMVGLPELLELRQILESEAAGYAALRATETQVRDLENMAWLMQKPNITIEESVSYTHLSPDQLIFHTPVPQKHRHGQDQHGENHRDNRHHRLGDKSRGPQGDGNK